MPDREILPKCDVSVIIVNLNTRDLLGESIRSVIDTKVSIEIIVTDNGSTDGSLEMVQNEFPIVKLIKNKLNEKFAKPNNDAMRIASGKYYLLLNSDASLGPGALQELFNYMEHNPRTGIVGPQLLNPDGSIQPSCRGFISPWTHLCDMLCLDRLFHFSRFFASAEMTFFDHKSEQVVDHVMAAVVLVRAEAVRKVGMFDERLSIYYNDLDLSRRMKDSGWNVVFNPRAQAVHHSGKTAAPLIRSREFFEEQYQNVFYYFRKHYGPVGVYFYKLLMIAGFFPRTVLLYVGSLFDRSEENRRRRDFAARSLLAAFKLPVDG